MEFDLGHFTVEEDAANYLKDMVDGEPDSVLGLRVFVTSPGTSRAETNMAYFKEKPEMDDIIEVSQYGLRVFIHKNCAPFLVDAIIGYEETRLGAQITVKAPNAHMIKVSDDSSLEDKITYIIQSEINPSLASHGGEVELVAIEGKTAVLRFGGGCQGCSSAELTLTEGIEKSLLSAFPKDLDSVRDVTDHSNRENSHH